MMKNYEKRNSKRHLPRIATRKPQLRNNSWAKLVSQQKLGKDERNGERIVEFDVQCEKVSLNEKRTGKNGQGPDGSFVKRAEGYEDEELQNCKKMSLERNNMRPASLGKNEEQKRFESWTETDGEEDVTETCRRTSAHNDTASSDYLPPIGDSNCPSNSRQETVVRRKIPNDQRASAQRKKAGCIDWQKIFGKGGFRPYESRDLPTRGEIILLKNKTWGTDDPLYCVTKCAKYFGLDGERSKTHKLHPSQSSLVPSARPVSACIRLPHIER